MLDRQWVVKERKDRSLIADMLRERGINSENAGSFFDSGPDSIMDPSLISGMDIAAERIMSAVENGEQITVFGDYDCDGITSVTLLTDFFSKFLSYEVDYYVPDRVSEGYGMSVDAIDRLCEKGTRLIITVDNGISAAESIKRASDLGIDVIVTDHHQCPERLPEAYCIIDPNMKDSGFTFCKFAGVGVAFLLVCELSDILGIERESIYPYLGITALGTIGDCVSLTGDNRTIVKCGLGYMQHNPGLRSLLISSGINPEGAFTASDLSFKVVPKINAAGRMGNAERAVELLLSADDESAEKYAAVLTDENNRRKETELRCLKEASDEKSFYTKDTDGFIISIGDSWPHGIVGVVASRVCEMYNKPVFILTMEDPLQEYDDENEVILKGSARAVPGFDLFAAISPYADRFMKFGGHPGAAGITLKRGSLPVLYEVLDSYYRNSFCRAFVPRNTPAECIIPPSNVTVELIKAIGRMEPFGEDNPKPYFIVSGLRPVKINTVGDDGKHLKFIFEYDTPQGGKGTIEGISYNNGHFLAVASGMRTFSVLCTLEINSWRGTEKPNLFIEDIHEYNLGLEKKVKCMYNINQCTFGSFSLSKNFMRMLYRAILSLGRRNFTFTDLSKFKNEYESRNICCSWYMLKCAASVFSELGLIRRADKTTFLLTENPEKVNLENSPLFMALMTED